MTVTHETTGTRVVVRSVDELDGLVRSVVEMIRDCTMHDYAAMDRTDAWIERDGKVIATGERKGRPDITHDHYPTALVDLAKWNHLVASEFATSIPALLFYGWGCGCVGEIRPAKGLDVQIQITTPSPQSRSLNRGVPRPTVAFRLADVFWLSRGAHCGAP